MPKGPDRDDVIRHTYIIFNNIIHYMIHDKDGAKKSEIIWMLEDIRRVVTLIGVSKDKLDEKSIKNQIKDVFNLLRDIVYKFDFSNPAISSATKSALESAASKFR